MSRGAVPIGNGPVVKVGKFVTLLGYEVIESAERSQLLARLPLHVSPIPFTTTGMLTSYTFTDWLSAQAGMVLGWDRSNTSELRAVRHRPDRRHADQGSGPSR